MRRYVVALALLLFAGFVLTSSGQVQESSNESRRVVQRVSPLYPSVAKRMNLAGTVKLVAVVGPDGKVKTVESVGGSPLLIQAARDAVTKWKYAPAASESRESVEFHFNPQGQE
ncbi:MAG TPA: energy transducer TonB [Candidatus Sulfotelmatobacter sp.]|nr:energy transducer TonB [Candidatus Sulfotelmatobacter sp.]